MGLQATLEILVITLITVVQGTVMWTLKELYAIRTEVTGVHARFSADIHDHERRLNRLEER